MADGKELKPKSFRIDDETAEKFKEISAQIGGNQQETLSKLIEAFEFQQGKAILTGKKDDIDQFDRYVGAITRMYMGALEDNQQLTETVRAEYDAQLRSKDDIIRDLQDRIKKAQETAEQAVAQADELTSQCSALTGQIEELTGRIQDKDSLNRSLAAQLEELRDKVEVLTPAHNRVLELQGLYETLRSERDNLSRQIEQLEADHKREMDFKTDEYKLALDRALLDKDRECQERIDNLRADHADEIKQYTDRIKGLMELQ